MTNNIKFKKSAIHFDFSFNSYQTYYAYFKSKRSKKPISVIKNTGSFVFEYLPSNSEWIGLGPRGLKIFNEIMDKGLLIEIAMDK